METIKVKKLTESATMPKYVHSGDACADLYADLWKDGNGYAGAVIDPHETLKVGTGLSIQPPAGYCALIFARSGLATARGLRPANCVGVCDEGYRGEYIVPLHNDTNEVQEIEQGDRIAQVMFVPYKQFVFEQAEELDNTDRGDGGFGSSGTK